VNEVVPVVETARLRLRAHRREDLPACLSLWSDPEVTRFISPRTFDREEVWARLLRYVGHWSLLGHGFWAIEEKESGRLAGEMGFAEFERVSEPPFDAPEAGFAFAPWAQGRGYAREALAAALDWADRVARFEATLAMIDAGNRRSAAVVRHCGYEPAGEIRHRGEPRLLFRRVRPSAG
jgi:RimJ/RimL family protein N-acetyltransferase